MAAHVLVRTARVVDAADDPLGDDVDEVADVPEENDYDIL